MKIDLEELIESEKKYYKYIDAIEKNQAIIYYKGIKLDKKYIERIKSYIEYWGCIHTISNDVLECIVKNWYKETNLLQEKKKL